MGSEVTRIAAVHLFALPLECAHPSLEDHPGAHPLCAVKSEVRGRAVLIDVSLEARHQGLRPGMTVTEARARLPQLDVRPRQPDVEHARLELAAEHLLAFGSLVEVAAPSFLYVEVGRSTPALWRMLGEEPTERRVAQEIEAVMRRAGHECSVAIARDPDTARTLAAHLSSVRLARATPPPVEPGRSHGRRTVRAKPRATASLERRAPSGDAPAPRARSSTAAGRGAVVQGELHLKEHPAHAAHERRSAAHTHAHAPEKPRPTSEPPHTYVVPPERELGALARLPLEALLWTDPREDPDGAKKEQLWAVQSALRILGVHDVAALRALPPAQVSTRFGPAGALLVARASAKNARPLRPFTPAERVIEEHELEDPVEDLEPILFVLRRIFARLESRLEARGQSAKTIALTFSVEPHLHTAVESDALRAASSRQVVEIALDLARPTRRAATMLAIAREKLGSALPGAVRAIVAEAKTPAADRGAQLDLFSAFPQKVEAVSELIGRLRASLGEEAVFSPMVRDTHRPEAAWARQAFEPERALAERTERPPKPPKLELARAERALEGGVARSTFMLPEVSATLAVAEMPDKPEGSVEVVLAELAEKKRSWPKAVERKVEDEPLPPLPPRPLELFEVPERATLLAHRAGGPVRAVSGERGGDRGGDRVNREVEVRRSASFGPASADSATLVWRGERIRLRSVSGCERLEGEWWTSSPLAREYAVAEAEDGRKLWVFFEPNGELFVHGVFD